MVLISLTVALTTAGAWLRIPLGPVPISLQTLFVLLSGAILGPLLGATAMIVYIALGLIGLPVFTAGGGPGYLFSPTFGFLLSFPLSAMVVGLVQRHQFRPLEDVRFQGLASYAAGTAVIYLIGLPWLWMNLKFVQEKELSVGAVLMLGAVPFLPGDLLKMLLASLITGPIRKILKRGRG